MDYLTQIVKMEETVGRVIQGEIMGEERGMKMVMEVAVVMMMLDESVGE
ncbi:hypothetical protein [Yersinia kristensenii]|nr:hypothetical protein [Yersinia kristensenii]EEP92325.1 hypothetical protein ykris0001_1500 [Yersinia kristensenii ATCC 33638]SUP70490.1 Uncharacterised protein [Yersinia kristensenii]